LALPFFGIGMKTELFQSCSHCWVFQICWHIECSTFTASSFRIWNSSNCCFLTCIEVSQEAGQVVWYSISFRIFQFIVIHTVKGFGIVNKAEIDVKQKILRRGSKNTPKNCTKKDLHNQDNHDGVITQPRARHPGMWSQVGLRKHHYKQS